MPRINTRNAYELIGELQPFTSNGAISADFDQAGNYVVRSYSTAIAVLYPDEARAVMNEAKYSVTTSKHQTQARIGIDRLGYVMTKQEDPAAFEIATGHRARLRGANW